MWQAARSARDVLSRRSQAGATCWFRKPRITGVVPTHHVPSIGRRRFRSALAHPDDLVPTTTAMSLPSSAASLSTAPELCVSGGLLQTDTRGAVSLAAQPRHSTAMPNSIPPEVLGLFETLTASQQFAPGMLMEKLDETADPPKSMEEHWVRSVGQTRCSTAINQEDPGPAEVECIPNAGVLELDSNAALASQPLQDPQVETKEKQLRQHASIDMSDEQSLRCREFQRKISKFMNKKHFLRAFSVLEDAIKAGVAEYLHKGMVRTLFYDLTRRNPFQAHRVLKFYQHMTREDPGRDDLNTYHSEYVRLCDSFRHLDPKAEFRFHIHDLVTSTVGELRRLDRKHQEQAFPVLVSALTAQKTASLGSLASRAYEYMIEQNFVVPPGYWEHLLTLSKFYRQNDIPFAAILERSVKEGRRPKPQVVLQCLGNLYPYTDTDATFRMLKSILELQDMVQEGEEPYRLDISTLELIGAAAAKTGFNDLNMVAWDMADALNLQPTEFMYENTILAFCAQPITYVNAFAVLSDMKGKGMEPSPALIRSMSTLLRPSSRNLDAATETLRDLRSQGRPISVAALNAVLSASAERGDVDRTMALLNDFSRNDVEPNADSYNFAFEALGKRLGRKKGRPVSEEEVALCLDTADYLLSAMEDRGIEPDHHIIRNYVELLCMTQEVDTANSVVRGSLEGEEGRRLINNKILYRVAVANAQLGQFDTAREFASYAVEPMPFLAVKIRKMESDRNNSRRAHNAVRVSGTEAGTRTGYGAEESNE